MRTTRLLLGRRVQGAIKSLQSGTITISGSNLTNTATVASVVPANTILLFLGHNGDNTGQADMATGAAYLSLTNATTITATRGFQNGTNVCVVVYQLMEFWPGVVSVQHSSITIGASGTTATQTINAVDVTRATIVYGGYHQQSAGTVPWAIGIAPRLALTNATTVTVTRNDNPGDARGTTVTGFCVAEWL